MRVLYVTDNGEKRCSVFEDIYFGEAVVKNEFKRGLLFIYPTMSDPCWFLEIPEGQAMGILDTVYASDRVDLSTSGIMSSDFYTPEDYAEFIQQKEGECDDESSI